MAQCGRILRKREKIRVVRLIGVIRVERFLVLEKAMQGGAASVDTSPAHMYNIVRFYPSGWILG
jgi:hypothetical protein